MARSRRSMALAAVSWSAVLRRTWWRVLLVILFSVSAVAVLMQMVYGFVDAFGPVMAVVVSACASTPTIVQIVRYQLALEERSDAADRFNGELEELNAVLSDRVESLAGFARTVAHDSKGPLTGVIGWTEIASSSADETTLTEALDQVNVSAGQAVAVVDGLLDMALAQVDGEHVVPVLPNDSLARALQRLADSGVAVEVIVDSTVAGAAAVWAHPTALDAVWTNLLSNAVKYGGNPPVVMVRAENRDERLVFSVDDNGVGVAEGVDPFADFSGEKDGWSHGLGLAIVRAFVTRFGGSIGFEPRVEGGTRFWFSLRPVRLDVESMPTVTS